MLESRVFEQEVRRVARELFPSTGGFGPVILDGRERDLVINDGETIHILEATCNTLKSKAAGDLEKSYDLKRKLQPTYTHHNFHIWLITEKDPTADQLSEVAAAKKKAKCPVTALSLSAFSQRLVDAPSYLAARVNYPFGSVRNPDPAQPNKPVEESQFIPLDLVDADSHKSISPADLADQLQTSPRVFLLLGDYGAGKSMTMRHLFYVLRKHHSRGSTARFPVFLNLRDHIGQDSPSSALFDHGTRIGFSQPERLVRAWRAGFVHLFLDGFDEIASSRFRSGSHGLREVRRRAMKLVRAFVEEHPVSDATIFISGRINYFGSMDELKSALGLTPRPITVFTLHEFSTEQVQQYLKRLGLQEDAVPDWLPSRPLLVGYLAIKGVLHQNIRRLTDMSRAEGWDYLLDQIAEREGRQIEDLGGQSEQVRHFIDRLATKARATSTGRGPIPSSDLIEIFRQVFPSSPDEAAQQLLLRMSGLTVAASAPTAVVAAAPDQEDAREFVDSDLVDAARAGDVARFVKYSYDEGLNKLFSDRNCQIGMQDLGVEVAARKLQPLSEGQASAALKVAGETLGAPTLGLDILRTMQELNVNAVDPGKAGDPIIIKDGYFPSFEFASGADYAGVVLQGSVFESVYIDRQRGEISGPHLRNCLIDQVFGVISRDDLPPELIDASTQIDVFKADVDTAADIRSQPLPAAVRVLLITLRKLFIQPGSGRKENAFTRGLDDGERPYVDDVLGLILRYHFASPHRLGGPTVWIPNRAKMKEVMAILRAPQQSNHILLTEAKKL